MRLKWVRERFRMGTWISDYSEFISQAGNVLWKVSKVRSDPFPMRNQLDKKRGWLNWVISGISASWVAIGVAVIKLTFIPFNFNALSFIPRISLIILFLVIVVGLFGATGKRWAHAALLMPVLFICIYTLDVCYAYLFHGRFTSYYWTMLVVTLWVSTTWIITV